MAEIPNPIDSQTGTAPPHPAASPNRMRPVLPMRSMEDLARDMIKPAPKAVAPNPFAATEAALKGVAEAHRALANLAALLIGDVTTPLGERPETMSMAAGLFGVTTAAAVEIEERAAHMRGLVERLSEHLS